MDFAAQSKKRAQESQDYCAPHFCTPFPVALYLRVLIRSELAAVYVTYCYSFCFPVPVPGHGRAGVCQPESQAAASTVLARATLPNSIRVACSTFALKCQCVFDGG